MDKTVDILLKGMKEMGATDAHFTAHNIRHTKGLTAVISVYEDLKPAQMVLQELYEWAEQNDKQEVKDFIDNSKQDMSWNADNPV